MIIRIGCVDGNTYTSDNVKAQEIQEAIDAKDGYLFGGEFANDRVSTPREAMENISNFIRYDSRNEFQTYSMMIKGRERKFNAQHIVWWEFDFNDEGWDE